MEEEMTRKEEQGEWEGGSGRKVKGGGQVWAGGAEGRRMRLDFGGIA